MPPQYVPPASTAYVEDRHTPHDHSTSPGSMASRSCPGMAAMRRNDSWNSQINGVLDVPVIGCARTFDYLIRDASPSPGGNKKSRRRSGSQNLAGSPYGIRTRDLRLERAVSLAARRRGLVAGDPGFEPGLTDSESAVLPLNESPSTL